MTFKDQGIEAFPLSWPPAWKRTISPEKSQFKTNFTVARSKVIKELRLLGCGDWNVIISSNIPLRKDGLPYANFANIQDPGIAVYFRLKDKPMVIACDKYKTPVENMTAVAKTIEALRGIKRWGTSELLEKSFDGFQALPPGESDHTNKWWFVLSIHRTASIDEINQRYKSLAKTYHPDNAQNEETRINYTNKMAALNKARTEALQEKGHQ